MALEDNSVSPCMTTSGRLCFVEGAQDAYHQVHLLYIDFCILPRSLIQVDAQQAVLVDHPVGFSIQKQIGISPPNILPSLTV